jgi:SAM-dependent methyltransferase
MKPMQKQLTEYYKHLKVQISDSEHAKGNEIYGELYYQSVEKLLKHLKIGSSDHFLDIGSGLGKLIFQVFLTTPAYAVTGVEINAKRYAISNQVKTLMMNRQDVVGKGILNIIEGDFLYIHFKDVTIAYVCSTVFSYELLEAIGQKINAMSTVHTVVSLRKLPGLLNFKLSKTLLLQGTWDSTFCYIYARVL